MQAMGYTGAHPQTIVDPDACRHGGRASEPRDLLPSLPSRAQWPRSPRRHISPRPPTPAGTRMTSSPARLRRKTDRATVVATSGATRQPQTTNGDRPTTPDDDRRRIPDGRPTAANDGRPTNDDGGRTDTGLTAGDGRRTTTGGDDTSTTADTHGLPLEGGSDGRGRPTPTARRRRWATDVRRTSDDDPQPTADARRHATTDDPSTTTRSRHGPPRTAGDHAGRRRRTP